MVDVLALSLFVVSVYSVLVSCMVTGRLLFGISAAVILFSPVGLGSYCSGISVLLGLCLGCSWFSLLSQRTFFFCFACMPNRLFLGERKRKKLILNERSSE
jgi:hypothetical protein